MSESEYRSLPALNASRFKAFHRSPYHFLNQKEVETTEAMKIGTAIHTAMLQPNLYSSEIGYLPDVDGRTTEGKAIKRAFEEMYAGKTILKAASKDVVDRACSAIVRSDEWDAIKATKSMRYEQVLMCDLFGTACKSRLDLIDVDGGIIRDIKSCDDASIVRFSYTVKDRLYWLQAGFYTLMAEQVFNKRFNFEFIAVETSDPSVALFHPVDEQELLKWKRIVEGLLHHYKVCENTGVWHKPVSALIKDLYIG
jgi:exodeoxyribonuclease VIII